MPKFWMREQMGKEGDINEGEAWQWFQTRYPALANWLTPFADKARKRGDKGEFWWELRACAYYHEFEQPKIFYPGITDTSKFHFDTKQSFSGNTGYFLLIQEQGMTAFLNSKVIWFLLMGLADSIRGGFYRMFSQSINQFPVPDELPQLLP